MKTEEEICAFIRANLVAGSREVTPDTAFDALGLDSFSIIELILFIERRFGVSLPDKELTGDNLRNARTLSVCVEKYIS